MRPVDTECAMEQFARVRFLRAAPNNNMKKKTDERSRWGSAECPGIGF